MSKGVRSSEFWLSLVSALVIGLNEALPGLELSEAAVASIAATVITYVGSRTALKAKGAA